MPHLPVTGSLSTMMAYLREGLLLAAFALPSHKALSASEPSPQLLAVPLAERPLLFEPPSANYPSPPPPPPPVAHIEATKSGTEELNVVARTRLTVALAKRGDRQLRVKLSSGFHAGGLVVVNPGGPTEERGTVQQVVPLTLNEPLRFAHGIGETIIELSSTAQHREQAADEQQVSHSASISALLTLHEQHSHPHHERPPAAPPRREPPLLANLTQITNVGSRYVRTHVGVEAAAALLLAGLLALGAAGCVVQAACGYSLCCLGRERKIQRLTSPRWVNGSSSYR